MENQWLYPRLTPLPQKKTRKSGSFVDEFEGLRFDGGKLESWKVAFFDSASIMGA